MMAANESDEATDRQGWVDLLFHKSKINFGQLQTFGIYF